MKVSIGSTFYNDKDNLKPFLESVLNQTYQDIELVVKDAVSTDGSIEILKEYEEKFKSVGKELVWISEKDSGIFDGFSKANDMATGDYIIGGSDPYINNNAIKDMIEFAMSEDLDYIYGGVVFQRDNVVIRQWSGKPGNWRLGWLAATPTIMMKRSVWEKYGPFDTSYKSAADYKFQLRLFQDKTLKSKALIKPLVWYCAGGTSNGGFKANLYSIKECQRALNECGVKFGWFTNICKTVNALFAYTFASRKKVYLEDYQ